MILVAGVVVEGDKLQLSSTRTTHSDEPTTSARAHALTPHVHPLTWPHMPAVALFPASSAVFCLAVSLQGTVQAVFWKRKYFVVAGGVLRYFKSRAEFEAGGAPVKGRALALSDYALVLPLAEHEAGPHEQNGFKVRSRAARTRRQLDSSLPTILLS